MSVYCIYLKVGNLVEYRDEYFATGIEDIFYGIVTDINHLTNKITIWWFKSRQYYSYSFYDDNLYKHLTILSE